MISENDAVLCNDEPDFSYVDDIPVSNSDQVTNNHNIIRNNKNGHVYRYFNPHPWLHDSLCQTDHTLRIGQINIHSLIQHYDELCMLPIHTFDILCINETWLKQNHPNQSIELTFFADPLRHDRTDITKSCGGGCAIYYKFGIECVQLPILEDIFINAIDSTWARIKTPDKTLIIGTIYKPPDVNNVIFLQNMEDLLLHVPYSQSKRRHNYRRCQHRLDEKITC